MVSGRCNDRHSFSQPRIARNFQSPKFLVKIREKELTGKGRYNDFAEFFIHEKGSLDDS